MDTVATSLVERATEGVPPQPDRLPPGPTYAPYLVRKATMPTDPFGLKADQWRYVVARSPIVSLCIRTLILQITAIPWKITGDDKKVVGRYTEIVDAANGESFELFVERLVYDVLTVPFGGAVEPVLGKGDAVEAFYHVDGGTLFPTYDAEVPYVQVHPDNPLQRVYFDRTQLKRVMWAPIPDMRNYGWSRPPVMEAYAAVEALLRSDVFYSQFLKDTPEAGILDLMDMDERSAKEWVQGWQELMVGIDPLKIPVLYGHENAAKFIAFARTPAEITLPDLVKRYAEVVVGAFGMNIGDLGLFEHENTLAGSSRMQANSKRQGLGSLMRKVKRVIDQMLPEGLTFEFDPLDEEDRLRKATALKTRADTLKILATPDPTSGQPIFPLEVIRKQAILDGLIDVFDVDDVDLSEIEAAAQKQVMAGQEQQLAHEGAKQEQAAAIAAANQPPQAGQDGPPSAKDVLSRSYLIQERAGAAKGGGGADGDFVPYWWWRNKGKGGGAAPAAAPSAGAGPDNKARDTGGKFATTNSRGPKPQAGAPSQTAPKAKSVAATPNTAVVHALPAGSADDAKGAAKPVSARVAKQMGDDFKARLSPADMDAIRKYQGGSAGYDMNTTLRANKGDSGRERKNVDALNAALNKGSLTTDTVLYRGGPHVGSDIKVGSVLTDHGFTSTTLDKDRALPFLRRSDSKAMMVITAPKGTKGGYLGTMGHGNDAEKEFLLPSGSQFRVTKIQEPTRTRPYTVHVELVGQGGGAPTVGGTKAPRTTRKATPSVGADDATPAHAKALNRTSPLLAAKGTGAEARNYSDEFTHNGQDSWMKKALKETGGDGKPDVVPDVSAYLKANPGAVEMYRGVSDKAHAEQFRSGELFVGLGMRGNGTYAAAKGTGSSYDDPLYLASGFATRKGTVMHMALKPDARVTTHSDLAAMSAKEIKTASPELQRILADPGRAAVYFGYDAIRHDITGEHVVINRTALVVGKADVSPTL